MLAAMSPQQFDEWLAMYGIHPWAIEPATEAVEAERSSLDTFRNLAGV